MNLNALSSQKNVVSIASKTNYSLNSNGFLKIGEPLNVHICSFLNEGERANLSSCCKLLNNSFHVQQDNNWKKDIFEWKRLINSKCKIINFEDPLKDVNEDTPLEDDKWIKNLFDMEIDARQCYLEVTGLSLLEHLKKEREKFITNFKLNDQTSIIITRSCEKDRAYLVNSLTKAIVGPVSFSSKFINYLGKDSEDLLEFATGDSILKCFASEKAFFWVKKINVDPEQFLKKENFGKIPFPICTLLQAFKVKNIYYFQWEVITLMDLTPLTRKVITCMRDIDNPHNHEELLFLSNSCAADDDFFYINNFNKVTIYKSGQVWKELQVSTKSLSKLELYPTFHGLVIKAIESDIICPRKPTMNFISIWNHRTKAKNKKEMHPIFEMRSKVYEHEFQFDNGRKLPMFVTNDLLFYKIDRSFLIYHIPARNQIGEFDILDRDIKQIVTSRGRWPKQIIAFCSELGHTIKNEFRVFSGIVA